MAKKFLNIILNMTPIITLGLYSVIYIFNGYLGYLANLGILCTIILIIRIFYQLRKQQIVKRINIGENTCIREIKALFETTGKYGNG